MRGSTPSALAAASTVAVLSSTSIRCRSGAWPAMRGRNRGSFAHQVKRYLAFRRIPAMLEQENPLPRANYRPTALHGNRKLGRGQCTAQVRGHVVGPLLVMLVRAVLESDDIRLTRSRRLQDSWRTPVE